MFEICTPQNITKWAIHNLYCSRNTVSLIKWRRSRWLGHAARM